MPPAPAQHYRPRHRLTHEREFDAVYNAKVRKTSGPLTVFAMPNDLGHARLGLSVGKKIGSAVQRNAVKRRLREAFRMNHEPLTPDGSGFDYVVNVRIHEPMKRDGYAEHLLVCAAALQREWAKRIRRDAERKP